MENINLIDSFAEFKEFKNIDRATLMRVLEDIFRNMLLKRYGTDFRMTLLSFVLTSSSTSTKVTSKSGGIVLL